MRWRWRCRCRSLPPPGVRERPASPPAEQEHGPRHLDGESPLRILVVVADVHSQSEASQEIEILRKLQADFKAECEIQVVEHVNRERLFQALNEYSYHILLFIGNGHPLLLDSNSVHPTPSQAQALALIPEENKSAKSQRTWDLLHAQELIEVWVRGANPSG